MRVRDFHFDLPEDLIAQTPPPERGSSRMLLLDRQTGALADRQFRDLLDLLQPGDLLVLNDTRVLPARLFAHKQSADPGSGIPAKLGFTGGASGSSEGGSRPTPAPIEILLTEPHPSSSTTWNALVRPAKKVRVGDHLLFAAADAPDKPLLRAEVIASSAFGERTLRFAPDENFATLVDHIGHMPLPPYIRRPRNTPDRPEDRDRYQTVYSQSTATDAHERSAAAPTAGLHFTPEILAALTARGVELATLTLHVGLGTFQPVRVDTTDKVRLHPERYTLSPDTAAAINRARAAGRRILAVGTTTTRTLEHCARLARAHGTPDLAPGSGETSLFLSPGDEFHLVSGLLTNFHLPESTLLMLVSAFAGREPVLHAYRHAVRAQYRFFSYGDCMLLL